jgi:allantoin racemase
MKRIVLVNPNTSEALTMIMVEIAREYASAGLYIDGLTVSFGPPLITCDTELDEAARSVLSVAPELAKRADAVIIGAFGDPGADALSGSLDCPVVGIAEAAMRAAVRDGRRFAVVTHTPRLVHHMTMRAETIGLGAHCVGVLATEEEPAVLMATPDVLEDALNALSERAIAELGAEAIIIGGGPLGRIARALNGQLSVPVIEPIPEAVRHVAEAVGVAPTH